MTKVNKEANDLMLMWLDRYIELGMNRAERIYETESYKKGLERARRIQGMPPIDKGKP